RCLPAPRGLGSREPAHLPLPESKPVPVRESRKINHLPHAVSAPSLALHQPNAPLHQDRAGPDTAAAARLDAERRRLVQPVWTAFTEALGQEAPGTGVLLAVSGGRDSAVLLEAAARWPRRDRLR